MFSEPFLSKSNCVASNAGDKAMKCKFWTPPCKLQRPAGAQVISVWLGAKITVVLEFIAWWKPCSFVLQVDLASSSLWTAYYWQTQEWEGPFCNSTSRQLCVFCPQGLRLWVEAAEAGVVVVSFGIGIRALPSNLVDKMAGAFARLPQRVVWRWKGNGINFRLSWMKNNVEGLLISNHRICFLSLDLIEFIIIFCVFLFPFFPLPLSPPTDILVRSQETWVRIRWWWGGCPRMTC